jgi:GNAT superfamily N-acetyltransferase
LADRIASAEQDRAAGQADTPALRTLTATDLSAVLRLQAQCYPGAYLEPEAAFAAKLQASPQTLWGAGHPNAPGELLAYLVCLPVQGLQWPPLHADHCLSPASPDGLYLHDLSLHPDARGRGVGQALVQQARLWAQTQGLKRLVLIAVQGSQPYWRKLGFTPIPEPALRQHQADTSSFGDQAQAMWQALG